MNEARRMHYLEAMGVDMYVPRLLLSNALKPVACELPIAKIKVAVAPSADSLVERIHSDALEGETLRTLSDGLNSVLSELSLDSKPKARPSEAIQAAPTKEKVTSVDSVEGPSSALAILEQATPTARFKLNLWFADSGIQILDSCVVGDALPTEALLLSILKNTDLLSQNLPPAEQQVWPFPGRSGDQSWTAASSMMNDFFQYRFELRMPKAMLIFGEDATKAVLGEGEADFTKQCHTIIKTEAYPFPILVLPALRDFLYEPKLKKPLWSLFKLLKASML